MNCPECGRFMVLICATEIGIDSEKIDQMLSRSAFWWVCSATGLHEGCWYAENSETAAIPAPEYDWFYWASNIPQEDLDDDPDLKNEAEQLWQVYQNRPYQRRKYPTGWNDSILIIRSE